MNKRLFVKISIFTLLILTLYACDSATQGGSGQPFVYQTSAYSTMPGNNQEAAYAAAQATLAVGQSHMMELSHRATSVSLQMAQAANAVAQSTQDEYQRQLMELSIQGTEVSLNIAQAAATQQSILQQTQRPLDAAATAQSRAVIATDVANAQNVTRTAQYQAYLNIQATQYAQANATRKAEALTATPLAAIQAGIVRTRNEAEQRTLWSDYFLTPLKVILATLIVFLLIVGGVMAFRRLMPLLELRLRTVDTRYGGSALLLDGKITDPIHPQRLLTKDGLGLGEYSQPPTVNAVQVEIIGPSEPSIINWVNEAEQELRSAGRSHL
jgi:hypothetical protein